MSEYQYYEFLAVDQPLTDKQIEAVERYSTRAEITSTRFVNVYHWGDFRGNVRDFLKRFFDLHVYVANWGTHRFAFRAPAGLIDRKAVDAYAAERALEIRPAGEHVIFDVCSETEDDGDIDDGTGWMASLAPLREEVLSGDLRCLYLAWLSAVQEREFDDDQPEPPVPPGLRTLSAAQQAFAEFIRLDDDLLAVAAAASPPASAEPDGLAEWIAALPEGEKNDILTRLCNGTDPHVGMALRRRFQGSRSGSSGKKAEQPRRTVAELLETARVVAERRQEKEARLKAEALARQKAEEAQKRAAYLTGLASRQTSVWQKIEALITTKQPKNYDEAAGLIRDLRDVAAQSNTQAAFKSRLANLRERHTRKPSMIQRLDRIGLEPS